MQYYKNYIVTYMTIFNKMESLEVEAFNISEAKLRVKCILNKDFKYVNQIVTIQRTNIDEGRIIGYHSTDFINIKNILQTGFNPVIYGYKRPSPNKKLLNWTWFTKDFQFRYGDICFRVDLTGLDLVTNNGKHGVIISKESLIEPSRILNIFKYEDYTTSSYK